MVGSRSRSSSNSRRDGGRRSFFPFGNRYVIITAAIERTRITIATATKA